MNRLKPTEQIYSQYTSEDFSVWKTLYNRQMETLRKNVSNLYLDAVNNVGFNEHEIPEFSVMNARLKEHTGWEVYVVPELVPTDEFFVKLAQRKFPATCWLRTQAELNYIEEPDMFHDVFGHVPLLSNKHYADFMEGFGQLALKWQQYPEATVFMGRLYWFTIEFGMLYENGVEKIFGAGIISSIEETKHCTSPDSIKQSFDLEKMLTTSYRTDTLQPQYFAIDSFAHLCAALPEVDALLERLVLSQNVA